MLDHDLQIDNAAGVASTPKTPSFVRRLAKLFGQPRDAATEAYPHSPEEKALIANLSAHR